MNMVKSNLVSVKIPAAVLAEIDQAIVVLENKLMPLMTDLTPDVRRAIDPLMNIKVVPFVLKALEYAEQYPDIMPEHVNITEMKIDIEAAKTLLGLFRRIEKINDVLSDTIVLSAFEAIKTARVILQVFRAAAKAKVTGTEKIVYELNELYDAAGLERSRIKKK